MHYTLRLNSAFKLICLFGFFLVFSGLLVAQDIWPIKVVGESTPIKQRRIALEPISIASDGKAWSNLTGLNAFGGDQAFVVLEPGEESQVLWLKNVNAAIPDYANIESIQLHIYGAQTSTGIVEKTVQWYNESLSLIGQNKANDVLGTIDPWTTNTNWKYGGNGDVWMLDVDPALLNDVNTGVRLQLVNNGSELSEAQIDLAYFLITYRPAYDICEHDCVSFFVEDLGENIHYEWTVPAGYHNIDNQPYDRILNLGRDTTGYGIYEVCVQASAGFLTSDICCRNFRYGPCGTGSLGDLVWHDENVNGLQDEGEEGLANLSLSLFNYNNEPIASTTTDGNGKYVFTDLEKGNYRVSLDFDSPYFMTVEAENPDLNSDFAGVYGNGSGFVYVDEAEDRQDLDFGLIKYSKVGDYVWFDDNRDGIQDSNESGIADVQLSLIDADGNEVNTVFTDAEGFYLFEDLYPATYSIEIALPDDRYELTSRNIGETTTDSDFYLDGLKITTGSFEVWSGQIDRSLDAGFRWQTGEIDGIAWYDLCADGTLDAEDSRLENVLVSVFDCSGNFVSSSSTDNQGFYSFEELIIGDYYVVFESLTDHVFLQNESSDSQIMNTNGAGSTACVTVQNNETESLNGGYTQLSSIGDYVWYDENRNGIQDEDENGLANVLVELKNIQNELVASISTNSNGAYFFNDLYPAKYYLEFSPLENYLFTSADIGNDQLDSDVNGTFSFNSTGEINLKANQDIIDVDAGLKLNAGKVEGYAWHDENINGLQDANENPLANIEVNLFDCDGTFIATTVTDANGNYIFCDVIVGQYYVSFGKESAYEFTTPNQIPANINSDVTAASGSGTTDCIQIDLETTENLDAGYYMPVCIGDFVWLDLNQNGLQDNGESGVGQVTVSLFDENGAFKESQLTSANGRYEFTGLKPGNYYLHFAISDMFLFTQSNAGDETLDSDVTNENGSGTSSLINLWSGIKDYSIDAGLVYSARSISGTTWIDESCDGILQANEAPKADILVELLDDNNQVIASTTTNVDGAYSFEEVPLGEYIIRFGDTNQLEYTLENQGNNEAIDSDAIAANNGATEPIIIDGSEDISGVNAGYKYITQIVTGYVWADCKVDGIQQTSESAIAGVAVNLFAENGDIVQATFTDENGEYELTAIALNDYYLVIDLDGMFYMQTLQNAGNNDAIDSDFMLVNGVFQSPTFNLNGQQMFDAGFYEFANLSGTAWLDANMDGVNNSEAGLADVMVYLMDEFMNVVASGTTNANGTYQFNQLIPGIYNIGFDMHPNYIFSLPDLNSDSDIALIGTSMGVTSSFVLRCGESLANIDAGYEEEPPLLSSISGQVFEDFNADGVNENEGFFINHEVSLYNDSNELIESVNTNELGEYSFTVANPGSYYVVFENTYELSPYQIGNADTDSDIQLNNGIARTDVLLVLPGENLSNIDAGFFRFASLGDFVWFDDNKNGLQDLDELGVADQSVMLFDSNDQLVLSTSTDDNGMYSFNQIRPGSYYVSFGLQTDYEFTTADQGNNEFFDSDVLTLNGFMGSTAMLWLDSGEENLSIDAGMSAIEVDGASLNGLVFEDLNADGLRDSDPLIEGVSVMLFDQNDNFVQGASTDENGMYAFLDIVPETYYVVFDLEDDQLLTYQDASDENVDSDVSLLDGIVRTNDISLSPGENLSHIDAGFYYPAALGDQAWLDLNENGKNNPEDTGIENIEVRLLDDQNNELDLQITDEGGFYRFDNLRPGTYVIGFGTYEEHRFTKANVGINESIDSDVLPDSGLTEPLSLSSGEVNNRVDAGYRAIEIVDPPAVLSSIAGNIFEDANADGLNFDATGLANIEVDLYDEAGEFIESTLTNNNGNYVFGDLSAGAYFLEVKISEDFNLSPVNVGADDTVDSDYELAPNAFRTAVITLGEDEHLTNVDAGFWRYATIGDLAWLDADMNGLFDLGELGVDSIDVFLYSPEDDLLQGRMTNEDGLYLFTNVIPGSYYVEFSEKSGLKYTFANVSTDDTIDSDVSNETGRTAVFNVKSGENDLFIDAGYIVDDIVNPPVFGTISGNVFEDMNADGLNLENNGIAEAMVEIFNADGLMLEELFTDENGNYTFSNLVEGMYFIAVKLDEPYNMTNANVGSDDSIDSDFEIGQTGLNLAEVFLGEGEDIVNVDAGYYRYASLGDMTWFDENENGKNNAGEPAVSDIEVKLFDLDDNQVAADITDVEGHYLFANVVPGSYYLSFSSKEGLRYAKANVGSNESNDSDVVDFEMGTTDVLTIVSGQNRLNVDVGYREEIEPPAELGSICGMLFHDLMADGVSLDDPGMADVSIDLLSGEDELLASISSEADGSYCFENLPVDDYYLRLSPLNIYNLSPANVGANDAIDSDFENSTNGMTTVLLSLGEGEDLDNVDAGIWRSGSIGDYVWLDENGNGLQNVSESGIDSIEVSLFNLDNDLIEMVHSDSEGVYMFANVEPGSYYLSFSLKEDLEYTTGNVANNNFIDSDVIDDSGNTETILILSGELIDNVDAGYFFDDQTPVFTGSISGFLFEDMNGDGLRISEPRLANREVNLYNSLGIVASTSTDENGFYTFNGLSPDTYSVQAVFSSEYELTDYQVGDDPSIDNDFIALDDLFATVNIDLGVDEVITSIDCGVYRLADFSGLVWNDENGDGLRQETEELINEITVVLLDEFGSSFGNASTDVDGTYTFEAVPGTYMIGIITPDGFSYAQENVGSDDTIDSDIIDNLGPFGVTNQMSVESAQSMGNIDAGLRMDPVQGDLSISGTIIEDLNGNGLQNPNDPPLSNIEVSLYTLDTILIANEMSDEDGNYRFSNLAADDYFLVIEYAPSMDLSFYQSGIDPSIDSDFQQAGLFARTEVISLSTESVENIDALLYQFISIGDFIWNDLNANGIQETGEPGMEGLQVILFDNGNNEVASVTSDEEGQYSFDGLRPGNYRVNFILPKYYIFSEGLQGGDATLDSDIVIAFGDIGTSNFIPLASGETRIDIDAAAYLDPEVDPKSFLFGFVWEDLNADGILGNFENGTNGIVAALRDENGDIVEMQITANHPETDKGGYYEFTILTEGTYYVSFDLLSDVILTDENIGLDELEDSDAFLDGGVVRTSSYDIDFGDIIQGVNAGYYTNADLTGFIWFDENQNGIQNDIESGLEGFSVLLYRADGSIESMSTSDEDGQYSFNGIKPGNFFIRVDLVPGIAITIPNQGSDDSVDSDVDGSNGPNGTANFNLISGTLEVNLDIGLILEPSSIGDFVWDDLNGDGLQSPNEPGINDVIVDLYYEDGSLRGTTTTATIDGVAGSYLFETIEPGNYYIRFQAPNGYLFALPYEGANAGFDSNVTEAVASGSTDLFPLGAGLFLNDIDAGLYRESTIGDLVWSDDNRNGIKDSDEQGLADIEITLYRIGYGDYGSTTSDNNGFYNFSELPAGQYYISVDLEGEMQFSAKNVGGGDNDSDVNEAGNSDIFTLGYQEDREDLDVGVHPSTGLVGKEVWLDENGNGLKDFEEVLMANIEVNLLDAAGVVIRTTATDHAGQYTFDNLDAGDYQVEFVAPMGYEFTKKNQGFDDSLDSDVSEEGMSDMVFVDPVNIVRDLDAGIFEEGSVKPEVWLDLNKNGIREASESSLRDYTISLIDGNDQVVASSNQYVESNSHWKLIFNGLAPGEYYLKMQQPANYQVTTANIASEMMDSDAFVKAEWIETEKFLLKSGETLESVKIGLILNEVEDILSASVFPNPTAKDVVIQWSPALNEKSKLIRVFDQLGILLLEKEVTSSSENDYLLSLESLSPGVYQLYIYSDNKRFVKQIIKL